MPADASLEQIQARQDEIQARIDESTKRMLRTAHEASESGAATLGALHQQGETLDRVRADQKAIDDSLATSDQLLRGLESWRGAASNALSSWWYGEEGSNEKTTAPAAAEPAAAVATTAGGGGAAAFSSARSGAAQTATGRGATRGDASLSELSSLVSGLCAQANAMNSEISAQNTTIDAAMTAAEAQSAAMKRNTQRTKAISGGGSWFG